MAASVARIVFYSLLIWVPIPLGSNRPVFWLINAFIVLAVFATLFMAASSTPTSNSRRTLALLLIPSAILVLWMIVQAVSFTPEAMHSPVWQRLGSDATGAISANPAATLTSALQFVTIALVGIVAARISLNQQRSMVILRAVIASSCLVAVWGLYSIGVDEPPTLFGATGRSGDSLSSFFVNRNTTATFLALGLAASTAVLMARLRSSDRGSVSQALAELPRRAGPMLAIIALLGVSLAATGSRAGVLAGGAGLVATFMVGWRRGARVQQATIGLAFAVVGGAVLLFGTSSDTLFLRLGQLEFAADARWELYRDTVQAIIDRPILGHGAGTFADFFPFYHSADVPSTGIWLEAHNTYLQSAAELGLPAFSAATLFVFVLVALCLKTARRRSAPAATAAVGAAVVVGLHSFLDFSLQIQAVAIVFAVLLGSGVAVSSLRPSKSSDGSPPSPKRQYGNYVVLPESLS